ncbi:methionine--tRNA ligase, mitochondrial [Colletes gigas]|uniref:methionine--tRNA ligase, mitochondrial n=1 Tax=Colletes gigas TaxID=935657 RepID=UPI001C9A574C|nr:methionine--tRNA ligase, mitochondrial [Colletes gigas]
MAISLRNTIRLSSPIFTKYVYINTKSCNKRFIMTSRSKLEKVLQGLEKNPYFDKYADKIAKSQKVSPEEFSQRVENEEKKQQRKKVSVHLERFYTQSSWSSPFLNIKVQPLWAHIKKNNFSDHAPKNMYITTPIFYVNAGPHIGHLYTAALADAIARFNSMLGHSVFLCTGTDEHGTKVENAARAATLPTSEYCTKISGEFLKMCDIFQVQYSEFIRTTEERHQNAVHHFWNHLDERGHIYMGKYAGWYSVSDETFISDAEVIQKKDITGIKYMTESGNPVEWTEEDSYKFRLTSFQDDLKHWLKDENTVQPAMYHKILSTWIEEGLQDISISRPISRVPWAIPVPSDKSHTIYVWFDALVNYLTAIGYPNSFSSQFWPPTVQVVGKDILKFHGILWPAFLMAAGLEPPKKLLCHGHWTINDLKMSKFKRNVISPFEAKDHYTPDGLRYYLLRQAVLHSNANYNVGKIENILNNELAGVFGNLLHRCLSKAINPKRIIPDPTTSISILKSEIALANIKVLEEISDLTRTLYEECHLCHVVDAVMNLLRITNRMFDYYHPWHLCKSVKLDSIKELEAVLSLSIESVRVAAIILHPIIPRLTSNLLDTLQISKENRTWEDTKPLHVRNSLNGAERIISRNEVLFKKVRNETYI